MLNSGLDPELLAGQVYQQGNVTSTRTANFWYSRRAIFVEAAGKLLTDAGKWKKLVQKLQPRTSVVGKGEQAPRAAIICFDCENFTRPGAMELAAGAARGFRARLGEISQALGINLPVYALFTKMDRLPFFTEYVRNFSNDEASQVLGVTLPMLGLRPEGVYAEQEAARLNGSFESLFRSLADARIEFLPRENDSSKLPAEYEFPREFRKTRQTVVQFLVDLCRPSQLAVGPFLRGFYFTGVRPVVINETAPVQAAVQQQAEYGSAAGATGIFRVGASQPAQAPQQVVAGSRKVPQWMFLGQFFTGVLLTDRGAMGASGASTRTSGARRILFALAAALCFLFIIFFTISFFNNRALETQVRDAAQGIASAGPVGADLAPVDSLRRLETLRQSVETLTTYHREGAPLMYRWGLFAGNDLYPEARSVYFARFKQLLFDQTQTGTLGSLRGLPLTAGPAGPDYAPTYDALKSYLITTSNHDKSTKVFLAPVLMKWWQNGKSADPDRQQLAQKQFDFYSEELREENPFTKENDALAIEKARKYLSLFGGEDRVYAAMLTEAAKNPPIDFNRQFPGSAPVVVESHLVSGAFSKAGWASMKDALQHPERYFKGEQWVLGDQAPASIDPGKLQALRARYYGDFIKEWRLYVKSATVARYASLKDASQKLTQLSGIQSPLLELFSLASTHTDVDEPAVKGIFQPIQTVVPPGSTDKFIAPPNQSYMTALSGLQAAVESVANQPGQPSDTAAASVLTAASQAKTTTRQMAQAFNIDKDGHIETNTQKLLEDPITSIEPLVRSLGPAELNAKAGKDLCGPMRALMAKYPFSPNSKIDATIPDVNSVFKPKEGAIWVFYDANLQKLLQKQGSQYVPVSPATMTITPAFLKMMNNAAAFTDVAYGNGPDPHFNYNVKPDMSGDTDEIKLAIDGQSADFTGSSPPAKQFVWPGSSHGLELSVKLKGSTPYEYPSYPGLWAVFKFIANADKHINSMVETTLVAGRDPRPVLHDGKPVTVRLDITANPPVFEKGYFSGMACVAEVAR
jgi:type VI secretion system protein ImpL